jgi:hypothetical protein
MSFRRIGPASLSFGGRVRSAQKLLWPYRRRLGRTQLANLFSSHRRRRGLPAARPAGHSRLLVRGVFESARSQKKRAAPKVRPRRHLSMAQTAQAEGTEWRPTRSCTEHQYDRPARLPTARSTDSATLGRTSSSCSHRSGSAGADNFATDIRQEWKLDVESRAESFENFARVIGNRYGIRPVLPFL